MGWGEAFDSCPSGRSPRRAGPGPQEVTTWRSVAAVARCKRIIKQWAVMVLVLIRIPA